MSEVKFGRGGIPDWLEPMVRFCSRCGVELTFGQITGEERDRLACPSCGFSGANLSTAQLGSHDEETPIFCDCGHMWVAAN